MSQTTDHLTPEPDPVPRTPEEWEQIRRSVAMLSPGAWALRREPALHALGLLIGHLRAASGPPGSESGGRR